MKYRYLFILLVVVVGCDSHYSPESFDLNSIEIDAAALIETGVINLDDLPDSIGLLMPKAVYLQPNGLYIKLDESFVSESGLFIPRVKSLFVPSNGVDPEFIKLSEGVYSYVIKG